MNYFSFRDYCRSFGHHDPGMEIISCGFLVAVNCCSDANSRHMKIILPDVLVSDLLDCFVNLDFFVQVYFRSANRCSIDDNVSSYPTKIINVIIRAT
ncbi:hypothetical protein [Anaerorudis cellulosivorans]|uniref:hypothetical protein n=1 Tax=Anaerorudis cellulosivorans TaxID=3397862 RepID=UPI00221FE089|nr:hypothetical protein [Seramator thermalis]MCW1734361.1 hypothetical protein [Seramator thermalis]